MSLIRGRGETGNIQTYKHPFEESDDGAGCHFIEFTLYIEKAITVDSGQREV